MASRLKRPRRPSPIKILDPGVAVERRENEKSNDSPPKSPKTSTPPSTPSSWASFSISQSLSISATSSRSPAILQPSIVSSHPSQSLLTTTKATSVQSQTSSLRLLGTTTTAIPEPPTRTTFITVTAVATLKTPEEKEAGTPEATKTVFVTGPPQVVTVPPESQTSQTTAPSAGPQQDSRPSAGPSSVVTASTMPPAALKFIIALSVLAGISVLIIVVAISFRQRKKNKNAQIETQPEVGEVDHEGFRAVPDTAPILQRQL